MDRGPLRELRLGPSRPRPRIRGRACARRERQIPRGALPRLRQHGRLSRPRVAADVDAQHRQERGQRLSHSADRSVDQGDVHQHGAGVGLSRCRPSRGQLLHGAADRSRGRRDEHRPALAAQAQPDQAERNPLLGFLRHEVRQRRFPGGVRARRRSRGRRRASSSASASRRNAASCAGSASAVIWRSRPRRTRKWAASASNRTAT